jgi:hypothetical protein
VLRGSIVLDEVSARVSYPDRFRESSIPWTTSASIVMIHVHVTGFSLRHTACPLGFPASIPVPRVLCLAMMAPEIDAFWQRRSTV